MPPPEKTAEICGFFIVLLWQSVFVYFVFFIKKRAFFMLFFQNLHKICTKINPNFWGFDLIPKNLFAQNPIYQTNATMLPVIHCSPNVHILLSRLYYCGQEHFVPLSNFPYHVIAMSLLCDVMYETIYMVYRL